MRIASSSRACKLLHSHFGDCVHEIKGFNFACNKRGVSKFKTLNSILKNSSSEFYKNFKKYAKLDKQFKLDIGILDFESFSYYFAKMNKLPIFSIDNMQVIDRCKLDIQVPLIEKQII